MLSATVDTLRCPMRHSMESPPQGRCARCANPAAKWIGRIDELPNGHVVRRAVGVCQSCYDQLTAAGRGGHRGTAAMSLARIDRCQGCGLEVGRWKAAPCTGHPSGVHMASSTSGGVVQVPAFGEAPATRRGWTPRVIDGGSDA